MCLFMYRRLRTYAKRIIHAFSTRTRVLTTILFLVISGWLVSQFVLAEKEMNVFVFPSAVSSDGWSGDTQALGQDLSPDATLADFNSNNSASVNFGTSISTNATPTASTSLDNTSNTNTPPLIEDILPLDTSLVGSLVPASDPLPAAIVPSIGGATSTPIISLPNPFVPTTPVDISSSSPQSKNSIPNAFDRFFGVKEVLAIETASGTPTDSAASSRESLSTGTPEAATPLATDEGISSRNTPTPMSSDPYTVASCTTLGLTCHMMTFVGFGLGEAFAAHPLSSATLELSLAGRAELSSTRDRLLVRIYHAGRWEYLGETEIKGELSNAKRGGYLSYELPSMSDWKDLADLKVVVEYAREGSGDASAYVDGLWINAKYSADSISANATPEEIALTQANVRSSLFAKDAEERNARRDILDTPEGESILLSHEDVHADAKITIKTDKEMYHTLGNTSTYFNVTNQSDKEQVVRLQFHFPTGGGGVFAWLIGPASASDWDCSLRTKAAMKRGSRDRACHCA